MKMSKLFVQTLREYPNDAEVISHKLLVRAGYIKKLASGIYNYMPLMQRVLRKIENIVREEMDKAGAQELLMPFVQPEELWRQSGRWDVYGKELMRLKDRHDIGLCLGPTHEEVITSIARDNIRSYRQLPLNLYQIQSKFRDEIRPRFGLLRGREFIMKDAYSFHTSQKSLDEEYENMAQAYKRIFERCGLDTRMVQSDSGAIGGAQSHEFMVLTKTDAGENDVFYCDECGYAANSNHAVSKLSEAQIDGKFEKCKKIHTPGTRTIEELCEFLNVVPSLILKSVAYLADGKPVMALIRGDKNIEETKLKNAIGANDLRPMSEEELIEHLGCEAGYISAEGRDDIKIIADLTVKDMKNYVEGANEKDYHFVGKNHNNKFEFADIRLVEAGEFCAYCGKELKVTKGIEVGNIFKLGTKYSDAMQATYTDEDGSQKPFIMGCYGIGVSRTAAAAVERYHDDFGISWPVEIAPYKVIVIPVNIFDETQMKTADEIYQTLLNKGIDVVIDDRDERAGVKFKDADLIGFPFRITVGKGIKDGLVEFKLRNEKQNLNITADEAIEKCLS